MKRVLGVLFILVVSVYGIQRTVSVNDSGDLHPVLLETRIDNMETSVATLHTGVTTNIVISGVTFNIVNGGIVAIN